MAGRALPEREDGDRDATARTGSGSEFHADAGWGKQVKVGKCVDASFSEDLLMAALELVRDRWKPAAPFPSG